MATSSADLLLHPVRLRILQALLGDRRLTTGQLRAELDDVPPATLYRHVGTLADAGVLEVVDEQRIRGAVERTYALRIEAAQVAPEELERMGADDHRQAFMAFVAGLLADFDRYLGRAGEDGLDLAADGVGYRQAALWLDDEELTGLIDDLRSVLMARAANTEREGRKRRILATVLMPGS
jgi:DNA-binding transcriptional ArsR family regulator